MAALAAKWMYSTLPRCELPSVLRGRRELQEKCNGEKRTRRAAGHVMFTPIMPYTIIGGAKDIRYLPRMESSSRQKCYTEEG